MDNVLILDEKTLKRIPPLFTLLFVLLLGFPAVALHYFGVDFSNVTKDMTNDYNLGLFFVETQIRSYFIQVLLQWSAFSLAAITTLLAFTQYRLTNDRVAFIIGLTILISGTLDTIHTTLFDSLSNHFASNQNLDAILWTFNNTVSGIIIIIGLPLLLKDNNKRLLKISTIAFPLFILALMALIAVYYAALLSKAPTALVKDSWLPNPFELIYLFVYLVILFFSYPRAYLKTPGILTNCIFYISITHIIIAIYLYYFLRTPYDNIYDIAYFLKIIIYFVPFSCLIINYVFSYNQLLEVQNNLQVSQENLKFIASHDALTNLYNRREFENLLDMTIADYTREYESFALFLIDIDNFKSINDTLGHIHGDRFLKQFSEQLNSLTRQSDVLSRIGGDEFTVIMPRLKTATSARRFANRLINGLNIPYLVDKKLLSSTVSVGISIYPIDGKNTEELLKNADIAMYYAKKSGKNTFRFYTEKLSKEQHREAEIESHLRQALKNDEFTLFYQPQYNLITKEVIGAEILLRWNNKDLGDISPEEFIPIAENSNLIISIGNWVLHKACEQAKLWYEKYHSHLLFSINVSPAQFTNNDFYLNFKNTIDEFDFPANDLNIEITESLLMKNNEDISLGLNNIGLLGTKISLDDFGIGYSSLSRLQSLPINTLKIDKLFVANIHNEVEKVAVIDTIIKLAHELGMTTIAEGIETQEQLNYLISKNCHLGQGFHLKKPISAEQFEKLVYL